MTGQQQPAQHALQFLLDLVGRLLQVEAAEVLELDETAGVLVLCASSRPIRPEDKGEVQLPLGESPFDAVVQRGEILLVPDVSADQRFPVPGSDPELRSLLCAPLILPEPGPGGKIDRRILGLVQASNKQGEGTFSSADVATLERLAFQIAVILDWDRRRRTPSKTHADRRRAFSEAFEESEASSLVRSRPLREMGVARLAQALAKKVNLAPTAVRTIRQAGFLHNIGKFGLPDHILLKPGPLTPEEREVIEAHPLIGVSRLAGISYLEELVPLIRSHQERYDGTGYPDGLRGEEIPLGARIIAIANAFDVMINDQPYRPAMTVAEACATLEQEAGQQFDPELVKSFVRMIHQW